MSVGIIVGGLDGLAEALGADLALDIEHALAAVPIPQVTRYGELVAALIDAQLEMLRNQPVMQRIIAWELSEANALTRTFAEACSQALSDWLARIKGGFTPPPGVDAPAVNAVLIAAIQQMVLSAASIGVPKIDFSKIEHNKLGLVELRGIEPLTSAVRLQRSPI